MCIKTNRYAAKQDFLSTTHWANASVHPIKSDASTRLYSRLVTQDKTAIFLDASPDLEAPLCPPSASEKERAKLGYNALARLAGSDMDTFVHLAKFLRQQGIYTPEIYAYDANNGFALLEDLGSILYKDALGDATREKSLYKEALMMLLHLQTRITTPFLVTKTEILTYDETALLTEAMLLPEYYITLAKPSPTTQHAYAEFQLAWQECFKKLSAPHTFVLRDFHAENLLWRQEKTGLARIGVIDFQDGLFGHGAYDLASILEDARRDVSKTLQEELKNYYLEKASCTKNDFSKDQFLTDYAILAAQRNAKILGVFARLIIRDRKEKYRAFLPRVRRYFAHNLTHDAVAPVRRWVQQHVPELLTP